jgi:hypothetical protein
MAFLFGNLHMYVDVLSSTLELSSYIGSDVGNSAPTVHVPTVGAFTRRSSFSQAFPKLS